MNQRMKKIMAMAMSGVMVMGLAACSGGDSSGNNQSSAPSESSANAGNLSVGLVVKTATNAHFQDIAYGAMLAGKDLGIEVKVDNTTTEADVEGQITKCENLISAGVDALILTPNESDGVGNAVNAAYDAGIPFVTADTEITNQWGENVKDYLPNFVGEDYQQLAYELARSVFEEMNGEGNVVILRGVDAASSSQQRTAGIEQAAEEFDGITIVQSQSANYDQDTAATKMADIVQAHKDIDAVICCNDLMAVGAVSALKENGIEVGGEDGILVAGLDGNLIALESIDAGEMFATIYDWSMIQGYASVQQAYALIQGEEVPEETLTVGTIITADNVDEFLVHGREISSWSMGSEITSVSDYMREFLENGLELNGLSY